MKAVISAYARTPFHFATKGMLAQVRPDTLLAEVIKAILDRTAIDPDTIEDVIAGCAYPEGAQGNNVARIAALLAGLPVSVTGMTINRFCGSSMSAVHMATAQIEAGLGEAYLCVGVESMTMVPQGGLTFSPHPDLLAHTDAYISMGETAENVAAHYKISRTDQDAFAVESHRKAVAAYKAGQFEAEIIPILLPDGQHIAEDGCIRPNTSLEALANLRPVFRADGVVTAGTSSPLTDGAAAVLVTTEAYAERFGLTPLARITSIATAGVDPAYMGLGPIPATRKALMKANIQVEDLDIIEINEAFASQALACIRELKLADHRVNLDGGALSIGHPLGATGARIIGKAASLLQRHNGRYALATQCIGGGQGISTILEAI